MSNFASRLKELRVERNLTQGEFASAFEVTPNTVSIWERGVRKPEFHMLESIALFFDVSLSYLLGETEERCAVCEPGEVMWEGDAIEENRRLEEICKKLIRLSIPSRNIMTAAITQAFHEDAARSKLEPEGKYSVSVESIWTE